MNFITDFTNRADAVIHLDGIRFEIGGVGSASHTFHCCSYEIGVPIQRFEWKPSTYSDPISQHTPWPPLGSRITIFYEATPDFPVLYQNIRIEVSYEIYQGLPVISKEVRVVNDGTTDVVITGLIAEQLVVEAGLKEYLHVETNYKGNGKNICRNNDIRRTVNWSDLLDNQSLITSAFTVGPEWKLAAGITFDSFVTYELLHSVDFYEWRTMEIRKMYRALFPQVTDNPIFMHIISDDDEVVRATIDQATEAGFEMVIQSFGSDVSIESTDQAYIDQHKALYQYAHDRGIKIGAYTMLTVREDGAREDSYDSNYWGRMRDMTSPTFKEYWENVKNFIDQTGLDVIEIDGAYPMSINQANPLNSQVGQWMSATVQMGKDLRERGVYSNAADWFYLNGYNKCSMGYEEIAWSQPRREQLIFGRQVIYNGTYQKTPSMGWTFTPLEVYHGGGTDASFEPLSTNIQDYDFVLAQNFGSGVMGAYRGKRLFDSEGTKAVVRKWTSFYKKYRAILNSDIVHIKAPEFHPANDERTTGVDAILHVNPRTKEKGLMMVYNQTDEFQTETITVPLYYTGLTDLQHPPAPVPGSHPKQIRAYGQWPVWDPYLPEAPQPYVYPAAVPTDRQVLISQEGVKQKSYRIDSNGNIMVEVEIPPMSYSWFVLSVPEDAATPSVNPIVIEDLQAAPGENHISLSWRATGEDEHFGGGYHIYRNGEWVAKSFEPHVIDTNLMEETTYTYQIASVYGGSLEGERSTVIEITTLPDTTAPILLHAVTQSFTSIRLEFNEPLEAVSAEMTINYVLNHGISVESAKLQHDERVVLLTTEPMTPDIQYTLKEVVQKVIF